MFDKVPPHDDKLNEEIGKVLDELSQLKTDNGKYAETSTQLEKLYKLRDLNRPSSIDPNTVLLIAANLTGIILIVGFERANVITSKALSLVQKTR